MGIYIPYKYYFYKTFNISMNFSLVYIYAYIDIYNNKQNEKADNIIIKRRYVYMHNVRASCA